MLLAVSQSIVRAIRQQLVQEISELRKQLEKAQDVNKDKEAAEGFIEKCKSYVQQFPEDSLSANLLFQAADVSRGLGNFGPSIQMWGQVWRKYEQYEKAPDALFLQGFVYDSDLKDAVNAKRYYQKFLERYPEHELAAQVQQLLSVIGQSPEDLIRQFEKNNREE